VEKIESDDLDAVVSTSKDRLVAMRARYAKAGLEGFIVCDAQGAELRRWMGSPAPPSKNESAP
jgi:hypothetical protein